MNAIRYEVAGHVATITIDRPEKRNAMDWDVLADFHDARTAAALRECFTSDDHREGVASFLERRDPRFTGT